jgi:hypothetical protein
LISSWKKNFDKREVFRPISFECVRSSRTDLFGRSQFKRNQAKYFSVSENPPLPLPFALLSLDSSLERNNWYFDWIIFLVLRARYRNNKHHSWSTCLVNYIVDHVLCTWYNNNDWMETWSSGIS